MQVYDGNAVMMVEGSVVVRERWLWRTKLEGGYQRDTAARVSKMIRRDCRMPSEWSGELDMQVVAYCWSIPSPLFTYSKVGSERKLRGWMDIWVDVCDNDRQVWCGS
jgi:hypothetical protein